MTSGAVNEISERNIESIDVFHSKICINCKKKEIFNVGKKPLRRTHHKV